MPHLRRAHANGTLKDATKNQTVILDEVELQLKDFDTWNDVKHFLKYKYPCLCLLIYDLMGYHGDRIMEEFKDFNEPESVSLQIHG